VVVGVCEPEGKEIARGLVNYSSADMAHLCGARSREIAARLGYTYGDEVIHRERLVVV
jgi:glutamate 5-kinase